jgi:hypothetical protein
MHPSGNWPDFMDKNTQKIIKTIIILILISGVLFLGQDLKQYINHQSTSFAQSLDPTPTPTPPIQQNSGGGGSGSGTQPTPTQEPLPNVGQPFNYTPLPSNQGPEHDIAEVEPLTASRKSAQVDDSITFSVTIKNQASYNKLLYDVCFESTDGNFGCQFGISLAPGQTYALNNVGTWTSGGSKNVWITWSQDDINYYTPQNAKTVTVDILG